MLKFIWQVLIMKNLFILFLLFLFSQCTEEEEISINNIISETENGTTIIMSNDPLWSVPPELILDGGPGKDGIPSVDNPAFISTSEIDYLNDEDLILAIQVGEEIRAYPHEILDWHEIINDDFQNESVSVIYCPLTGTGLAWSRYISGEKSSFGVSGLLYNANIIPYDRLTNSLWSQIRMSCINGPLQDKLPQNFSLIEIPWKTWKQIYPDGLVLSRETGFNRTYGVYPYRDYRTNNDFLLFPVLIEDDRLAKKEIVLTVISDGNARAYSMSSFFSDKPQAIRDRLGELDLVIIGSRRDEFIVAFNANHRIGSNLTFNVLQNDLPNILVDNEGNKWNLFGIATEGPRKGQRLDQPLQMKGYWFSFASFYPEIELYE